MLIYILGTVWDNNAKECVKHHKQKINDIDDEKSKSHKMKQQANKLNYLNDSSIFKDKKKK